MGSVVERRPRIGTGVACGADRQRVLGVFRRRIRRCFVRLAAVARPRLPLVVFVAACRIALDIAMAVAAIVALTLVRTGRREILVKRLRRPARPPTLPDPSSAQGDPERDRLLQARPTLAAGHDRI